MMIFKILKTKGSKLVTSYNGKQVDVVIYYFFGGASLWAFNQGVGLSGSEVPFQMPYLLAFKNNR